MLRCAEIENLEEDVDLISGSVGDYAVFCVKSMGTLHYFDVRHPSNDSSPEHELQSGHQIVELRTAVDSLLAFT